MSNLPKPTQEGEKIECPNCGIEIISRLKTYKDNRYKPYIQWQNLEDTNSHLDPNGKCRGLETETPQEKPKETPKPTTDLTILASEHFKTVHDEAEFILKIRKEVLSTVRESEVDPHPGMIWEMTALIFQKHYGVKKQ